MKLMKTFMMLLSVSMIFSQSTVTGTVTDSESGESLIGANILVKGTTLGAATDIDGKYSIDLDNGSYTLTATYVGYVDNSKSISVEDDLSVDFELKSDVFSREVTVSASRAKLRETPVAFSDISEETIENRIATQDVPMLLNNVPGVYASEQGGGSGDSRVSIRGFDTENIAVMINGVPVNDMENGRVYWSNWSGLGDITKSIQVQRGLGASKLSVASVGGTINVITKSTDMEQKAFVKSSIGSFNTIKSSVGYSTGLMDDNTAFTFMLSKKDGDGYADQTWSDEMTYFASYGVVLKNHSLNINLVGTPQRHGQRYNKGSIDYYKTHGLKSSNSSWGTLNGEKVSVRENFYHKPVVDLNHTWAINNTMSLTNVLYASWGTGGGKGNLTGKMDKNPDGTYDIQSVYDRNSTTDKDDAYDVLRASRNNHNWYGIVSTFDMKLSDNLNLTTGIDARYYEGEHYRTVEDLWGADKINYRVYKSFAEGGFSPHVGRTVERNEGAPRKYFDYTEGDIIAYHNDGLVRQYGLFAQVEHKKDQLTSFVNASMYQKGYKRIDYFSYVDINGNDIVDETEYKDFIGGHIKAGANYNIDEENNVFVNAGYLSVAPSFDAVWINFINQYNDGVSNEKVLSAELGYGYSSNKLAVNANAYFTSWQDRYYTARTSSGQRVNFFDGVTQNHVGFELDGRYQPMDNLDIEGSLAIAKNVFTDNFVGTTSDADGLDNIQSGTLFLKDLYIEDQPMRTASFGVTYTKYMNDMKFFVNPQMQYADEMYAAFDPTDFLEDANRAEHTWKLPTYSTYNLTIGSSFDINNFVEKATVTLNFYNVFDEQYVTDAEGNTASDVTVYYARPFNWNLGVKLEL